MSTEQPRQRGRHDSPRLGERQILKSVYLVVRRPAAPQHQVEPPGAGKLAFFGRLQAAAGRRPVRNRASSRPHSATGCGAPNARGGSERPLNGDTGRRRGLSRGSSGDPSGTAGSSSRRTGQRCSEGRSRLHLSCARRSPAIGEIQFTYYVLQTFEWPLMNA